MKKTLFILMLSATVAAMAQLPRQLSPSEKLHVAEKLIESYYVDDVNADTVVTEAIIAMLKTLDPHSAYSTPAETKELNTPLEGKFSGVGIQFSILRDTVCVVQTTQGGPSQRAGIIPGDRIIYVNDTIFTHPKMQNTEVLKTLRGPKGSVANLRIKRGDSKQLIDFRIVRDDIPIYSVDNVYMAAPEVGYIHISRFAEDTPAEVERAIARLKAQGMKHLIVDLEDNRGGYLGAAHGLSSMFLKPGDMVVYTKGKNVPSQYLHVEDDAVRADVDRLVILVNQYSASASEIFSGAMQDHDRGAVVGRRTFGKGLVQRPFPFPDGSMIRLTTSRYYTPSGRSIQKPYEKGQGEEYHLDMLNRLTHGELWSADSIKFDPNQRYETLNLHRTVYGGGGIMPDVFVPLDTMQYTVLSRDLIAKGTINSFVTDWLAAHRAELLRKYPTQDAFFARFNPDSLLEPLLAQGRNEGIEPKEADLERSRQYILAMLKGLVARDLYEDGSYLRAVNPLNPVFTEALRLITDPVAYRNVLPQTVTVDDIFNL